MIIIIILILILILMIIIIVLILILRLIVILVVIIVNHHSLVAKQLPKPKCARETPNCIQAAVPERPAL